MKCYLCPRRCGADRSDGQRGACGVGDVMRVSRIAPHYWEEPCISGSKGSGTVFFCGCPLGCVFCQNRAISRSTTSLGREYTPDELAKQMGSLAQGVHNINLVTPTHFVPQIAQAIDLAGLDIPVVYNSSGYELPETIELMRGRASIFLPDYKYHSSELAARYSAAADYPQVALAAIERMVDIAGTPRFDSEGIMQAGVIVRHLVLPGCADDSMRALRDLRDRFGDSVMVSIMSQYTPMPNVPQELSRAVTADEYELVLDYADHLGLTNGYRQEGEAVGESFIPDFE